MSAQTDPEVLTLSSDEEQSEDKVTKEEKGLLGQVRKLFVSKGKRGFGSISFAVFLLFC